MNTQNNNYCYYYDYYYHYYHALTRVAWAFPNTFQNRSVSSPAPVAIVWPSGDMALEIGEEKEKKRRF